MLQILHFVADLLGRLAQYLSVLEDQVDGANGERTVLEQHGTQGKGGGGAESKQPLAGGAHGVALELRFEFHGQPRSHHFGATAQHKGAGPAGPDILQAGQVFTQEAIEIGAGLALRGPGRYGNSADAQHGRQGQRHKDAQSQAHAPVHVIEQPEHPKHQGAVAEHIDHKP